MGVKEDLETRGYFMSKVNPPEMGLTERPWGYYRKKDGSIIRGHTDALTLFRNKNKGFVYLGNTPPDEPTDSKDAINHSI